MTIKMINGIIDGCQLDNTLKLKSFNNIKT